MNHKINKIHTPITFRFVAILLGLGVILAGLKGVEPVAAQSEDVTWSTPINLSKSSATFNPAMTTDQQGNIHVFWDDEFTGGTYTQGDGTTWNDPLTVTTPFTGFPAKIVADNLGNLHAFWTAEANTLYYSQISVDQVDSSDWDSPQILAENALAYEVVVDGLNQLHLIYVRGLSSTEFPAGIYYRLSGEGGIQWSNPTNLYESLYYRTLLPEDAYVDIATTFVGETLTVYASWDNLSVARIFLANSQDGGETWSEPLEVDKPDLVSGSLNPSHLKVDALGENVLLIWDSGNPESGCTSYYQWSNDRGTNWQLRQLLFEGTFGCPEDLQILEKDGQPLLFILAAQPYLQIWDGTRWSDPQPQTPLMNFIDAETQKSIELDCQQAELVDNQDLYVLGCDSNESPDVWWMQKPIGEIDSWFPEAPVWSRFVTVTSGELIISDPAMVTDADNLVHVVWVESPESPGQGQETKISYSRWEGASQWSQPLSLALSPESIPSNPATAIDQAGNLLIVWADGNSGSIYFSQVPASRAVIGSDWSEPITLPNPQVIGSSPDILVDGNGKIYVTFAVPINLGRGVYLTSSEDGGLTWSDPILAFDGEAAGWAMVDGPQLAESAESELHLIWYRYSPPDGPGPLGLFYSQSGDGGLSWATPEALVEKPIRWSQVSSKRDNLVHRIWKEETSGSLTIWHDLSLDNGVTWSRSSPVTVFGSLESLASLASDNAGQLHLVHLVNRGAGNHTMQHWIWGAEGWLTEQSLDFSQSVTSRITELSSIVTNQGDLTVVLNGIDLNTDTGKQEDSLLFTRREIELPEGGSIGPIISTPESSLTPTLAPTETSTPTPVATESPTNVTPQGTLGVRETENFEEEPDGLTSGSSMWWYAGGLAVFLAVVLVVVYTRKGPRTR